MISKEYNETSNGDNIKNTSINATASARIELCDRDYMMGVVLWGKRFRDYFTNYLLPSLFCPSNIKKLEEFKSITFIIYSTEDDFIELNKNEYYKFCSNIVNIKEKYFIPDFEDRKTFAAGQKQVDLHNEAILKKSLFTLLYPDSIYTSNFIEKICDSYNSNYIMCLTPCYRSCEELFIPQINKYKVNDSDPLIINSKEMTSIICKTIHSEFQSGDISSNWFADINRLIYYIKDNILCGMVFYWTPVFLDASKIVYPDWSSDYPVQNMSYDYLPFWLFDGDQSIECLTFEIIMANHGPAEIGKKSNKPVIFSHCQPVMTLYRDAFVRTNYKAYVRAEPTKWWMSRVGSKSYCFYYLEDQTDKNMANKVREEFDSIIKNAIGDIYTGGIHDNSYFVSWKKKVYFLLLDILCFILKYYFKYSYWYRIHYYRIGLVYDLVMLKKDGYDRIRKKLYKSK